MGWREEKKEEMAFSCCTSSYHKLVWDQHIPLKRRKYRPKEQTEVHLTESSVFQNKHRLSD